MKARGLFIGIDRYQSSQIGWLACAARDASTLGTLFADTFDTDAVVLLDAQATREAVITELEALASAAKDDVVMIAFSGHGTPTHELVLFDTDPDQLAETTISLDWFTELFKRIPAKNLVLILDCCFSGGMGAKVLVSDHAERGMKSVDVILNEIAGEGRLILTASSATQPAWENQRLGHGFLTQFLLEGLRGANEVVESSRVQIYKLLEYVTKRVQAAAKAIGKEQTPTFLGQLEGSVSWPIFESGSRFAAAFPDLVRSKATKDPASLAAHGVDEKLLACWQGEIQELNDLQLAAVNDFAILEGENLLVSAPTSSGKTMIGELASLRHISQRRRAIFLLPLKALVNDKHRQFARVYGAYGVKTIRATGDSTDDVPALMRGQYDICLMTYEKFSAMVLGSPHLLEQPGVIVVDEVQMVADESRGTNLEFLLTLIRMRAAEGIDPQIVALSAVLGETHGFELWLGGRLLKHKERPIPLDEGLLNGSGQFRYLESDTGEEKQETFIAPLYRKGSSQDLIIPLVRCLVDEGKQVIVFRETKGEARGCASYLSRELALSPARTALAALPTGDPSASSERLRKCLENGVAFHVADLDRDERLCVEDCFRAEDSEVRVIVSTTTLAMGINTPAEAVVIAGLRHPGAKPYSVAEYKNIAGRAGRLGYATRGASFLIAGDARREHEYWAEYVLGQPESLTSRFFDSSQDVRSLVLRTLAATSRASGGGLTHDDVVRFLRSSFGALQVKRESGTEPLAGSEVDVALTELERHQLVQRHDEGKFELTELGRFAGEAGVEVESVTRLVDALSSLSPESITDPVLIALTQVTSELDAVYMPQNRRSTLKEPATWFGYLRDQGISENVFQSLRRRTDLAGSVARAKRAAACLMWMSDTPLAELEKQLLQHDRQSDAAGSIFSAASRTRDLLGTTICVAQILHPDAKIGDRADALRARLEVGIPGDLVELSSALGGRLSRSNYLALRSAGLLSVENTLNASDETLLRCLDGDEERVALMRARLEDRLRELAGGSNDAVPPLADYKP